MRPLTIGAVVAALVEEHPDVTISKIRFLEAEGLVTPERSAAGYRRYGEADVERLRYVLHAQRELFWPLKVIREALEAIDRGLVPTGPDARPVVPDPGPDPDVPDAGPLLEAFGSGDLDRVLKAMYEINLSPDFRADPANYEAFTEMASALPARQSTVQLQIQAVGGHDTQARLAEITAPTLVIHGTEDRMIPVANGELIASLIPGAKLEIFEGVGHLFWWERPERSAELIRAHALGA